MKIGWDVYNEEEEWGWDEEECDMEEDRNYQKELDNIPIEEIERYLRKKKLERIKKKDE